MRHEQRACRRDQPLSAAAQGQSGRIGSPGARRRSRHAKAADKPILLSIGYAACHWCHVMAHESFENDAIAALMNRLFVCIKVDREERPDLDAIYMQALHAMGEQGGWPLTMFLTPDARAVLGRDIFPAGGALGPAGISRRAARRSPAPIATSGRRSRRTRRRSRTRWRSSASRWQARACRSSLVDQAALRLAQEVDRVEGGIGERAEISAGRRSSCCCGAAWKRLKDAALKDAVLVTLDHICAGRHLRSSRRRLRALFGRSRIGSRRISRRCSTTTRC